MPLPSLQVLVNFSTGPSFAQTLILDSGQLDVNILDGSAAPIVDVSSVVRSVTTKRGRNGLSNQFQTGTLTLVIIDQNGDFNPQNSGSPYFSYLTPMKKVQITATYSGVTYPIFSGFITSYSTAIPDASTGSVALTTITAVDALYLAQNAQISTVSGATAGQLSGARINKILDQIDWPASMRDVDEGLTTMQVDPGTARTALTACRTVAESEFGAFYVDASGSFTFQDRALTASSVAGTPVVFADDGSGIAYFNAVWLLNDALIFNSAQITATGLATQSYSDAASIAKYFLHSYNAQNLLMEDTATALNYASMLVASNAETSIRCDAIELDLYMDSYTAGTIAALDLDFFDPVTISTSQPGSTTLTKTLQVFGKNMTIAPGVWKVTLTTLEPILDAFILDSALYGLLDTSVLSY